MKRRENFGRLFEYASIEHPLLWLSVVHVSAAFSGRAYLVKSDEECHVFAGFSQCDVVQLYLSLRTKERGYK